MQRTNIYLDERQIEGLDRVAADEGTSRADVVRRIIDRFLDDESDTLEADLAAIRQSAGAMPDIEVVSRSGGTRAAHLERMWRLGS